MKDIIWQGSEELLTGIAGVLAISIAAAIVNMIMGGWKGLRHFLGIVCICFVFALMANWVCLHYQLPLYASAFIIMASSILSFSILAIVFDPAIRKSCVKRLCLEIMTWKRGRKQAEAKTETEGEK